MLQYLVLLGAAISLSGKLPYIRDTLRGFTKPNRVSWLMWSASPLIAAFAAISDGVKWAVVPVFAAGFICFLVFLISFINPKSYWKLEKFDYICGFLSALALVLWAITKEPVVAIVLAIASDGLACVPTIVKSWKYPETETGVAYLAGLFSAATSFAAVKTWVFSEYAFATYLIIANIFLIFPIYCKRLFKKNRK